MLRWPQLREMVNLSRSTVWRLERIGRFPQRIKIGWRAVAWRLRDVVRWIVERNSHVDSTVDSNEDVAEVRIASIRTQNAILRWSQLKGVINISKSTVLRLERAGRFPKRIKLGT